MRFETYLPAGWERVDLTDETGLDGFVNRLARSAPPSRQPDVRRVLEESVLPRLREMADRDALALLLPLGGVDELPVRPLVTFRRLVLDDGVEPMHLLQGIATRDSSAELVELGPLIGLRTSSTADAGEALAEGQAVFDALTPPESAGTAPTDEEVPAMVSARVRYLLGDPDDDQRWVDILFAADHPATAEAESLAEQWVELFDALVGTFRWVA